MLIAVLASVGRALRNSSRSGRGRRPQRRQRPPIVEPLERRIALSSGYPRLMIVQRGAAVVGSVIGANTSTAKADILLFSRPGTFGRAATAQDNGSGPPYWSTIEQLTASSGAPLPGIVDVGVSFGGDVTESTIPLDMHGIGGTIAQTGHFPGDFITLKIAPGSIPPGLRKAVSRSVNTRKVMVNVEARYTSYVDNAKGSGITGEVQAFATYMYKGKPQTLIDVDDPPKTVLADAGTHFVARIGDTFQIRIFDRADVTLPADPQDSVGMSSGISVSVQVVPIYRGAAPGHKRP